MMVAISQHRLYIRSKSNEELKMSLIKELQPLFPNITYKGLKSAILNERMRRGCYTKPYKNILNEVKDNKTVIIEGIELFPVKGYEHLYLISKKGDLYSMRKHCFMAFSLINGYADVRLGTGKRNGKHAKIHQLVAITFIPNPENKPEINHKNGIRSDNRIENLEWCTRQENLIYAVHTLHTMKPPKMKLNEEQVLQIREKYKNGTTLNELSQQYNTVRNNIRWIVTRGTWRHI